MLYLLAKTQMQIYELKYCLGKVSLKAQAWYLRVKTTEFHHKELGRLWRLLNRNITEQDL